MYKVRVAQMVLKKSSLKIKIGIIISIIILLLLLVLAVVPSTKHEMPDYVYTDAMSLSGYTFAKEHGDILMQFDCYCGCYDHAAHTNLRDCFIFNNEFTNHASFCDLCKALNQKVQRGINEGKSVAEIKTTLKIEYGGKT